MKKIFFYVALFVAVSTACSKTEIEPAQTGEEPDVEVKMITETVTGGKGTSTKATIANSDASFKWSVGDNIAVHVSNGATNKYVFTSDAGASGASAAAAKATFTVVYPEGYSRDAYAVFPSTIVSETAANYGQSGTALDVTLPASYTLAQVSGETSPCPMISTNTAGSGWDFYQLCCLLRLTVNDIPATAKRLEIDFDGKKVCGDFSIADPISPSASAIATVNDAEHDIITITKNGSNVTFGETSLVLNIPLPTGSYSNISVVAYDALSGGTPLKYGNLAFPYTATNIKAVRRTITTNTDPISSFTFTFKNQATSDNLSNNLRFVRLFSNQNKLHNATSYGPYTVSNTTDMNNPVSADLFFDRAPGDQLIFQVVTADGKVYSGSYDDAPADGFRIGKSYDLTVSVNLYTFTVASGKRVYFSPGDLGVEDDTYSFTEPFTAWNQDETNMIASTAPSKRTWFIEGDVKNGHTVYGIEWRIQNYASEWKYLVGLNPGRTIDNGNVSLFYKVHINTTELGDRYWCYLLPPDEATYEDDIKNDLRNNKEGTSYYEVTDYLKYIAKGFVLLMDTEYSYRLSTTGKWKYKSATHTGYYQAGYSGSSKTYFDFGEGGPNYDAPGMGTDYRIHTRYIHDVTNP